MCYINTKVVTSCVILTLMCYINTKVVTSHVVLTTEQPMLDDLFIQDHYYSSVRETYPEDNRYIVFRLQQSNRADKLSFEKRSSFWYKMGEISRIVLCIYMLRTGPSVSSTDGKMSAVSEPVNVQLESA